MESPGVIVPLPSTSLKESVFRTSVLPVKVGIFVLVGSSSSGVSGSSVGCDFVSSLSTNPWFSICSTDAVTKTLYLIVMISEEFALILPIATSKTGDVLAIVPLEVEALP